MSGATENLFADLATTSAEERHDRLLVGPHVRIERIVSPPRYADPPGAWYDQDDDEWVTVLSGSAGLRFASENAPRVLRPGDHLAIPAHVRHRVEWTDADQPTVWLAVHHQ